MTYEEAKKLIARAEELAQAVKNGKNLQCATDGSKEFECAGNTEVDEFFRALQRGVEYRIAQPKTRRPWTQKEAEEHLGWVLVAPDGAKYLMVYTFATNRYTEGWQVHPVGQPDKIKPAYVEE